jgi:hypothetical protein
MLLASGTQNDTDSIVECRIFGLLVREDLLVSSTFIVEVFYLLENAPFRLRPFPESLGKN